MKIQNERMSDLSMSGGLYEIFQQALLMERDGRKVVHMEIGKPDYDSPQIAKEAVINSLNDGFVHYTAMAGIQELREAILEKEHKANSIVADPNSEIIVTAGACEALMAFMLAVLDPGDEILIPSPYFSAYDDIAKIQGVVIKEVPLKFENAFELKASDLEKYVTPKTKALLVNTPHNPTGAVIGKEELIKIAEFAKKYDLVVISDETYDQFLFEGEHVSLYTLPGMKERTVVINSTSKTFSMTGWRVGYAIGPKEIIRYMNKVHQNMSTCATSFVQVGAVSAFQNGKSFTEKMVDTFKERRDLVIEGLSQIRGIEYQVPHGAFYIFPKISDIGLSSTEFCQRALEETGVALVPGNAFGENGEGFIRLAYACSNEEIKDAMALLKRFVEEL
ncbi:MAG: pyridoxal phosphate-dependent aminotransferase [Anaerovorax sp.]|nr:pyridoxal phosphate-dependent aminotransferase [Anaerovorax sp.]